jgi:hypothetical protein
VKHPHSCEVFRGSVQSDLIATDYPVCGIRQPQPFSGKVYTVWACGSEGERLTGSQKVGGSSPPRSTKHKIDPSDPLFGPTLHTTQKLRSWPTQKVTNGRVTLAGWNARSVNRLLVLNTEGQWFKSSTARSGLGIPALKVMRKGVLPKASMTTKGGTSVLMNC